MCTGYFYDYIKQIRFMSFGEMVRKMFYHATAFNQDISKWNWKVDKDSYGCGMLTGTALDDPDTDKCKGDFTPSSLWGENFIHACGIDITNFCQ